MKKIIRLTESDLVRLVKRIIREQPSEWGRDSINTPGSWRNYLEGPGRIGNKDYDPEENIARQKRDDKEREEKKYEIGFMDYGTGREWTEDGLRSYVKKRFDVDLPDEVFSGKGAMWANASRYLKNYFG